MIRGFTAKNGRLQAVEDVSGNFDGLVWIDLSSPSREEEALLESRLSLDIPTREDMEEIEISSRLYYENGDSFMTATVPAKADTDDLQMAPVTFVLAGERLISIRYHDPRSFETYAQHARKANLGCTDGETVLLGLLETIVDRLADVLERAQREIDAISRITFERPGAKETKSKDLEKLLQDIGRKGDLTSNVRESLFTLDRLIAFLAYSTTQRRSERNTRARVKTLLRDVNSLSEHSSSLSQKITFLLDATLGMIAIEQNAIIKIFSIAAVVFLPPTLIASIYGMNFDHMPELSWRFGYPFAFGIMIICAVLPYVFFKRRGWL
ncbi:MAG: magnesium/cobalt transporter CorA [Woeseia sp.]